MDGLCEVASQKTDVVVNSVVGMVGLRPTLAALDAGNKVALANKETLVTGGELVMNKAKEKNLPILPIDSEHSAIFQSLMASGGSKIERILLTASGGPFFSYTYDMLKSVTKAQALKHPNWNMGQKITTDSATPMTMPRRMLSNLVLVLTTSSQRSICVRSYSLSAL